MIMRPINLPNFSTYSELFILVERSWYMKGTRSQARQLVLCKKLTIPNWETFIYEDSSYQTNLGCGTAGADVINKC